MREMVLNHASLRAYDRPTAIKWLKDIVRGMQALAEGGVAQKALWRGQDAHEIRCLPDWSLLDACIALQQDNARDERDFIMSMLFEDKRLLTDVDPGIKGYEVVVVEREARTMPPEDGAPLALCSTTDWIAVGFPTDGWNRDQLTIRLTEILDDGNIVETSTIIDNLALHAHARAICERHHDCQRDDYRQCGNGAELWIVREQAFPNLVFGRDVKGHIAKLGGTDLQMLIDKLEMLDALTAAWRNTKIPAPPGGGWDIAGVRDESDTVKSNPRLSEKRWFRSRRGRWEQYFLHTDFRGDWRIHFRCPRAYEVEIGYIGPHLPTARDPN